MHRYRSGENGGILAVTRAVACSGSAISGSGGVRRKDDHGSTLEKRRSWPQAIGDGGSSRRSSPAAGFAGRAGRGGPIGAIAARSWRSSSRWSTAGSGSPPANLNRLLERDPDDGEAAILLGRCEQERGRFEAAADALARVTPGSELAHKAILARMRLHARSGAIRRRREV